ncbi:uncharacterized protein [Triticum aestivum]|uniref:uncharacterized protein isoform X2 n=1 Tax=Triticum aestivum TaxID=4565 RepID=UPI001D01EEB4|nr:uncharacterized protein LOC123187815 isoform X2 [Triticum aestivum]
MEDVQLLVLLGLFSKRPSYRNSASGTQVAIPVSSTDSLAALEVFDSMQFSVQGPPLPCCDVAASPALLQVISSDSLEKRLRAIHNNAKDGAACHVLGHTHFCWDYAVDNIRYVQAPLAYPRERKRRINGGQGWLPFFVYCDGFNPETRIEGSLRTLSLRHALRDRRRSQLAGKI